MEAQFKCGIAFLCLLCSPQRALAGGMQSCFAHTILFAAKVLLGEPGLNFLLILLYIHVHFIPFGSTCLAVFSHTRREESLLLP